ncbi:hypothetical protein ACWCWE_39250, partial [Streptomyces sp. NPDC001759]
LRGPMRSILLLALWIGIGWLIRGITQTLAAAHTLTELEEHYGELLSVASLEPDPQEIDKHAAAFRDSVPVLRPPRP